MKAKIDNRRIANVGVMVTKRKQLITYTKTITKEYKCRHDWVGKVIGLELWRDFLLNDPAAKWHMHKPDFFSRKRNKFLWNWDTNWSSNPTQNTKELIKKITCHLVKFVSVNCRAKSWTNIRMGGGQVIRGKIERSLLRSIRIPRKGSVDLRRLAVALTLVKDNLLKLV